MFGLCNSMFFLCNRNNNLTNLQKYMFTNTNCDISLNNNAPVNVIPQAPVIELAHEPLLEPLPLLAPAQTVDSVIIDVIEPTNANTIDDSFSHESIIPISNKPLSPTQKDTLFWCIYIAIFGYNDYIQISRNYGVKELEIKQKVGEFLKTNQNKFKDTNYKITKSAIQEILSELLTSQKETSMLCLIAMTVYFNINIILINTNKNIMLEFSSNGNNTFVLYKDSYNKYSVDPTPISTESITELKQQYICLENYLKPLRAISTYKLDELNVLAERIGIEKHKKAELYELIHNSIMWI